MIGFSVEKALVLAVIAGMLLGPERLARLVSQGTRMLKRLRERTDSARAAMREELGSGFPDVDWQRLDPRRYDPRRIIADALFADDATDGSAASSARSASPSALDPLGGAPASSNSTEER